MLFGFASVESCEALKSGRNDTWMSAMSEANEEPVEVARNERKLIEQQKDKTC